MPNPIQNGNLIVRIKRWGEIVVLSAAVVAVSGAFLKNCIRYDAIGQIAGMASLKSIDSMKVRTEFLARSDSILAASDSCMRKDLVKIQRYQESAILVMAFQQGSMSEEEKRKMLVQLRAGTLDVNAVLDGILLK